MKSLSEIAALIVSALLVCWALAELRYEGWSKRRRRVTLLVVLAAGVMVIAHRVTR